MNFKPLHLLILLATVPALLLAAPKKAKKPSSKDKAPVVNIWNFDRMVEARKALKNGKNDEAYRPAYDQLIKDADAALTKKPVSVMDKDDDCVAISGNKHDFITVGKYSWPNPNTPDGLPWIQRDGTRNPNYKRYDAPKQVEMVNRVKTLCLAYFFSGDEKYAEKAIEFGAVWFLNPDTYMTPNLEYAQVIPGRDDSKGHAPGVIEGYIFVHYLAGISLLTDSKYYTAEFDKGNKEWFSQYASWLRTSKIGAGKGDGNNNIAVARDQQLMACDMFCGDMESAKKMFDEFPAKRIYPQIYPDGRMPMELKRTLAYSYSEYNIAHLLEICQMAKDINPNLFWAKSDISGTIGDALAFLATYFGKPVEDFAPYRQISGWEATQYRTIWLCKRAQAFDPSPKWVELFDKYIPNNTKTKTHINNLIY